MNDALLDSLKNIPVLQKLHRYRVSTYNRFLSNIDRGESVLDIGCGAGFFTEFFSKRHANVVALDVFNCCYLPQMRPVLYDGRSMPFRDRAFDWAILATVLHHTSDPARVLAEAARVASRIIVVEDVIKNSWHGRVTGFFDNLFNLEFRGNPHNNKMESEWRALFRERGLTIKVIHRTWSIGLFWWPKLPGPIWQHVYFLERANP